MRCEPARRSPGCAEAESRLDQAESSGSTASTKRWSCARWSAIKQVPHSPNSPPARRHCSGFATSLEQQQLLLTAVETDARRLIGEHGYAQRLRGTSAAPPLAFDPTSTRQLADDCEQARIRRDSLLDIKAPRYAPKHLTGLQELTAEYLGFDPQHPQVRSLLKRLVHRANGSSSVLAAAPAPPTATTTALNWLRRLPPIPTPTATASRPRSGSGYPRCRNYKANCRHPLHQQSSKDC
ncbi:MAG: hypothetical protein R3B90_12520 [Planctomycetaceae bacterium]